MFFRTGRNIKAMFRIRNLSRYGIRARILFFFMLLTVFSYTTMNILVYQSYYRTSEQRLQKMSEEVLKVTASNFDIIFNEVNSLSLDIFANRALNEIIAEEISDPLMQYSIRQEIENQLGQYMNNRTYIQSIRLYGRNFDCYSVQNGSIITPDNFRNSEWYEEAYSSGGRLINSDSYEQLHTNWFSDSDDSVMIISFARAIKELRKSIGKDTIGVLVIDVREDFLRSLFGRINVSENSFSVIYDDKGGIISKSDNAPLKSGIYSKSFDAEYLQSNKGYFTVKDRGEIYYITYLTAGTSKWKLVSYIPRQDMIIDIRTIYQNIIIFTLISILVSFLLSILMSLSISTPIKKLLKAIDRVRNGDFHSKIEVRKIDEVGIISEQFNDMLDDINSLLKENYLVKLKEQETEINSLQAQINPHFLYNTLDTIGWQATIAGYEHIAKMISSLGSILRYGISRPNEVVNVEDEFLQIENYLHIQKCRYEDRFEAELIMAPETKTKKIHKLMVQPLVENSITHGLEARESNGILRISSQILNEELVIKVYDNGCGIEPEAIKRIMSGEFDISKKKSSNIGIFNVRKRMELYYGEKYGLEIISKIGEFTEIILRFPIINEGSET